MRYSQPLSWARSRSLLLVDCFLLERGRKREEVSLGGRTVLFLDDAPLPLSVSNLHRATRAVPVSFLAVRSRHIVDRQRVYAERRRAKGYKA